MLGEIALKRVEKGEIIQLQRKGFFRCDVPYAAISPFSSREQPLILFHIPDGHVTDTTRSTETTSNINKLTSVKEISQENVCIILFLSSKINNIHVTLIFT